MSLANTVLLVQVHDRSSDRNFQNWPDIFLFFSRKRWRPWPRDQILALKYLNRKLSKVQAGMLQAYQSFYLCVTSQREIHRITMYSFLIQCSNTIDKNISVLGNSLYHLYLLGMCSTGYSLFLGLYTSLPLFAYAYQLVIALIKWENTKLFKLHFEPPKVNCIFL